MNYKDRVGKKCFMVTYLPEQQLSLFKVPFYPPFTLYVVAYTYEAAIFEANKRLCKAYPEGYIIKSVSIQGY